MDEKFSKAEDDNEKYVKKHERNRKNTSRRVVEFYLRLVLCITGLVVFYVLYSSNGFPYVGHIFGKIETLSDRTLLSKIQAAEESKSSSTEPAQTPSRMIEQSRHCSSLLIVAVS